MHFYALAVVPADGDLDQLLGETMAPFSEHDPDADDLPVSWDWWQVGGRWTGVLSGYDPTTDPANWETCQQCQGTGRRDDEIGRQHRAAHPEYGCNGCEIVYGTGSHPGRSMKWPTQWPTHPGDVVDARDLLLRDQILTEDQRPYAIFEHGSKSVALCERWTGTKIQETGIDMAATLRTILVARAKAGLFDRVVVIDFHC